MREKGVQGMGNEREKKSGYKLLLLLLGFPIWLVEAAIHEGMHSLGMEHNDCWRPRDGQ